MPAPLSRSGSNCKLALSFGACCAKAEATGVATKMSVSRLVFQIGIARLQDKMVAVWETAFRRKSFGALIHDQREAQGPGFEIWAEALQPWLDRFVK
jgi:hypothetical protein